jgi:hypothetical protein
MGLEKRCTTFRLSEETLEELEQIQRAFFPFAEDRSSTLRITVRLVFALIFTPMTMADLMWVLQRLHRNTSQYEFQFVHPVARHTWIGR